MLICPVLKWLPDHGKLNVIFTISSDLMKSTNIQLKIAIFRHSFRFLNNLPKMGHVQNVLYLGHTNTTILYIYIVCNVL